ncbi:aminoglycoside 3'-phosphotransferase [Cellulomonas gilvus]|uniref:Aminoglycoside phosphotransferase n=1 Tax=Cellulomonas gilvus (strain ATCC 13127 / NRRL B-14078) TaxID=593907 RepID=F8A0B8_CELGA|nr:aminoglycoside 3'-phosphotransferase [Cellulomonas gilvus]AEI11462.1 aminoglycoside phosphotransferase [Cellulomonas gilvus ATCC 13127]
MSIPTGTVEVPGAIRRLLGDGPLHPVWQNLVGGLTFHAPDRGLYAKWAPAGTEGDLADEAERLAWVARWTPVPHVVETGADDEGGWLVTRAIEGRSAVHPQWVAHPEVAVRAVGAGLRALHDALPVAGCPWTWSARDRLARVADRAAAAALGAPPPVDRLVVCHGDACVPNTLLSDDGTWLAHVDLGSLGVADRWADLAVATWSTVWNYGPGHEEALLDAYGIAPDPVRTAYYRTLWSLG